MILIGAGGHSKSVIDSIQNDLYEVCGFIDENKIGKYIGLPIFGKTIEDVPDYEKYYYFISIGDIDSRKIWFEKIENMNLRTFNIIDRSAIISKSVKIGTGNFVGKLAVINADSVIGNNNIINTKTLVEHECNVGNHTHLSTNSVINGNVVVEDNVFLGSSSVCNGQLKIGKGAIIGSGSVVINDIPPKVTVVGVPAKIIKGEVKYE